MVNHSLMTGLGAAAAVFLTAYGSGIASVPAGSYVLSTSGLISFAPIVISGVLSIYGIIVAILLAHQDESTDAYKNLCAGLAVGLSCVMSGKATADFLWGCIEDAKGGGTAAAAETGTTTTTAETPFIMREGPSMKLAQPSARFLMVMVFLEAIGLYGLIVALFLMN